MQAIEQSLTGLALGAPQTHRNLALFPLFAPADTAPGYLLLDEALARGLARITETSSAGSVPELAFENGATEKILLVDGDELIGAKQNRIINLSILVAGGMKIVIPVSCVEQGRWSYRSREFGSAGRSLFAKARGKKAAQVSASLRDSGTRYARQGEIWNDVAEKVAFCRADSDTTSMADAYEVAAATLEEYVSEFRAGTGQCGAAVAVDGKVVGLEVFDSSAAFSKYLGKLVRGYAMDAIETVQGTSAVPAPSEADVRGFLETIQSAPTERFAALGEGEDLRLTAKGIAGGALAAGGRIVHLAAFAVA
jgi:hypothetical protein